MTLAVLAPTTVCIDPGHPSEVGVGTTGKQISELHANWVVARLLETRLAKRGYRVVLTRERESTMVKNVDRARIANAARADLIVRLHCDAASGSGFTVYWPEFPGTALGRTGPSKDVIARTRPMAKAFHRELAKSLAGVLHDNGIKSDRATHIGGKQGALTGSIFSEVPVVLVEMVVLTNPKDDKWMASPRGQNTMADALDRATVAALAAR